MAIIEIIEDDLRRIAGKEVFGRALEQPGMITDLSVKGPLISATVDGTSVTARILCDGIVGE